MIAPVMLILAEPLRVSVMAEADALACKLNPPTLNVPVLPLTVRVSKAPAATLLFNVPPKVSVLFPSTAIVIPVTDTPNVPEPKLKLFEPAKMKPAFVVTLLLVARVTGLLLVLSMTAVAKLRAKAPVPMAEFVEPVPLALMLSTPAPVWRVVPPV